MRAIGISFFIGAVIIGLAILTLYKVNFNISRIISFGVTANYVIFEKSDRSTGKTYVESIVKPLFLNFKLATFKTFMSASSRDNISSEYFEKSLQHMTKKYGIYQSFQSVTGYDAVANTTNGKQEMGFYTALIQFSKGIAEAEFELENNDGQWSLLNIEIHNEKAMSSDVDY